MPANSTLVLKNNYNYINYYKKADTGVLAQFPVPAKEEFHERND